MISDRYGNARLAAEKDLTAVGVMTIPAAMVGKGECDVEEIVRFSLDAMPPLWN